jgi:hypothetical protein
MTSSPFSDKLACAISRQLRIPCEKRMPALNALVVVVNSESRAFRRAQPQESLAKKSSSSRTHSSLFEQAVGNNCRTVARLQLTLLEPNPWMSSAGERSFVRFRGLLPRPSACSDQEAFSQATENWNFGTWHELCDCTVTNTPLISN